MVHDVLGLVVARGGSKGVPRKNLCLLAGRPLIAYTFQAALGSRLLSRVMISTDAGEIADLAAQQGVEAPFIRPPELARDDTLVIDVAVHALEWLHLHGGYRPAYVLLLQPTSPLRTAEDIDAVVTLALQRKARAVVSVVEVSCHPCFSKRMDNRGHLSPYWPNPQTESRRQTVDPAYSPNGALYLVQTEILLATRQWCPEGSVGYVMPPERSIDVDSEWDFRVATCALEQDRMLRKRGDDMHPPLERVA